MRGAGAATRAGACTAAAVAALLAATGGLAAAGSTGESPRALTLVLVVAVGLLFVWRLDAGVCAVLVVRPALDAFGGRGGADAAGALAVTALAACGAWLLAQQRARPVSATSAIVPLMVAVVVSSWLSAFPASSLLNGVSLCASLAVFAAVDHLVGRGAPPERVLWSVLLGSVVPAVVGLCQALDGTGWTGPDGIARVHGTFSHPNPFGAVLALNVVVLVAVAFGSVGRARAATVVALPALYLLVETGTRSAWAAAAAGALVVAARRSARHAVVAGGALGLLLFVPAVQARLTDLSSTRQLSGRSANSAVWRVDHWRESLPIAAGSPLTGVGLGGVERASTSGKDPHNDLVRVIAELGALGVLGYGVLVREAVRRLAAEWRRPPTVVGCSALGAMAATAVLSLSTNVLGTFAVMTPAVALCALARRQDIPLTCPNPDAPARAAV